MSTVQDSVLKGMLRNIPDPKLRETYGAILSGKFPFKVYCLNPQRLLDPLTRAPEKEPAHKPGLLIGYIDNRGRCIEEPTIRNDGVIVGSIESSRDRFDGRKGFRCACGNWSIQSEEEKPVLGKHKLPIPPTAGDLMQINENLQKSGKKQGMVFIAGKMEYDGFMIEQVSA